MTRLVNDPADFADEALEGFVAAHPRYVRRVHGGVVRATAVPEGQVGLVIGGGTGHYPAFAGWTGPGLAHGVACGNIFASPSATQIASVMKAADHGGGLLVSFGNYAGDVLHFGQAAERMRREGIDVRVVTVTDDIASGPYDQTELRRGIAGDLAVFKIAGAAAARGWGLDEVERVARKANATTRTMGVAFAGCTLPGADQPLFTVPAGQMSIGLGIHGEPGVADVPQASADETVGLLWERLAPEIPDDTHNVVIFVNGLGTVKYEELFVAYRAVRRLTDEAGYAVVDAVVGEQCTSLDMAGLSLTVMWLDDELADLWSDPCDSPAFARGTVAAQQPLPAADAFDVEGESEPHEQIPPASVESQALARRLQNGLVAIRDVLIRHEGELGDLDAVAGDGDHGIGMVRGAEAAVTAASAAVEGGAGAATLCRRAGEAWSERAGGTSGALWGSMLQAVGSALADDRAADVGDAFSAVRAAGSAVRDLGGAQPGDKTMVDALAPFVQVLTDSQADGLAVAWPAAVKAARDGAQQTASIVARRGRSRVLGEKSLGTPDPGAVSFALVVDALTPHIEGGPA